MPEWRNWKTHWTQNPAGLTPRVGSTPTSGTCSFQQKIWEVKMGRALIIDDEESITILLKEILERFFSMEVDVSLKGKEAWNKIKENDYSLIISDIMIPDMSGYEITMSMRKEGIETPVIFITGTDINLLKDKMPKFRNTDLVEKPFEVKSLINKIRKYVPN